MDYEKKYKEALEWARKVMEGKVGFVLDEVLEKFSELKESEDERIRKSLIKSYINQHSSNFPTEDGFTREQILAWLEKQGEQNHTDNIEPKFKVDDWIINNGQSYLIGYIDYEQRRYLFEIGGYTHEPLNWEYIKNADNKYHLWTIKDVKDGDVLCSYECGKPKIVFILKGTPKKPYAFSYHCYYNIMYPHFEFDSKKGCLAPNEEDVKPATKEQRDLLFQKMKEAGYVWDEKKKELKENNYKDPYEQCIQYTSIEDGIKAHAKTYSFNIESELFPQLTKEQQTLWKKEIEQAVISGGEAGIELARDTRYQEN